MIAWTTLLTQVTERLRQDGHRAPAQALLAVLAMAGLQALLPVAAAILLGNVVDGVSAGTAMTALWPMVVVWGGLLFLTVTTAALAKYGMGLFSQRIQAHLSVIVLAKAAELDLAMVEDSDVQDVLFRAQHEAGKHVPSLLNALLTVTSGLMACAVLLVALTAIAPLVAALLVLPMALGILTASGWRRIAERHHERAQLTRRFRYLQRLLSEARAAGELRAFGLGGVFLVRAAELWQRILACQSSIAWWVCRVDLMVSGGVIVGLTAGAVHLVVESAAGALSVGTVVMVIQLQQRTYAAVHGLQQGLSLLATHGTDLQALRRFLALTPRLPAAPVVVPGPRGLAKGIQFEDVSFRYATASAPALHGVNLVLNPGMTVAVVGPNGSGKSTLLKLLCRLYDPTGGRILWDGTDLRQFDCDTLRAHIAVGFQDALRYQFDVRDNIALGSVTPLSDSDVVRAAQAAGAHHMIERLPDGYATRVGFLRKGGTELSGGQWQALTLSRTMTRDTPLILLDEPNQNLDPDADAALFQRLRTLMHGRTALFVSHRFSTARLADQIVVMDEGRIVEQGPHAALVASGGLYAHLFSTQAREYQ